MFFCEYLMFASISMIGITNLLAVKSAPHAEAAVPQLERQNILRANEGGKCTKYNKIKNNSENFGGGKIDARGGFAPCPPP